MLYRLATSACVSLAAVLCNVAHAQLPSIPTGTISIELEPVATGLASPVELVGANDGTERLFIVEQGGTIRILKNGTLNAAPFLNVSTQIKAGGERGLLGLAFHPDFTNPGRPGFRKLYTYQTENPSAPADFTVPMSGGFDNQCVVTEWQVSATDPDIVDPATRRDVLRIDHPQGNHNGGEIGFRRSDGYLYIAIGDGGNGGDVGPGHTPNLGNAQDTSNLLGKILRIDPLAPALTPASTDPVSGNGKYRNPASNPFIGTPGRDEIYAFGFRNPYRFSFDPIRDRLIVGDVGQGAIEEVDIVELGKNYGWNRKEGSFLFNANGSVSPDPNPNPAYTDPVLEYDHGDGLSVIAGFVSQGNFVSALLNKYVFGDFLRPGGSGRLFYGDFDARTIQELRIGVNPRAFGLQLKGFGSDLAGNIYALGDAGGATGGRVLKLVPIPAAPALVNLSTRLRVETGENVGIAGFIVTGSTAKTVGVRALGPSLAVSGQPVAGRMSNPVLTLFDGAGNMIARNDDWMDSTRHPEVSESGLAPSDAREAAEIVVLEPGAYTAVIEGVNGESGIGLIELYDVRQVEAANVVNISTRGRVQAGDNVMIGGFIIGGGNAQRVIVRASGPSLSGRGIADALGNPTLELVNASGTVLASNDNWRSAQEAEISESGLAPSNDAESAIIRTLSPGNYTGVVRGAGGTSGVALVEVYRLNPL
jgi:glucose/arabinose dehydrogenase